MKDKYKEGTKVFTDYFSGPEEYQEFVIVGFRIDGSSISLKLYNTKTKELYGNYADRLDFTLKQYNRLFFTKNELRKIKLKTLNESNII